MKARILLWIIAVLIISVGVRADVAISELQYKFNNDYVDSGSVGTNLAAGGSGNSFDAVNQKVGTHALSLSGSGYATHAGTGLATGNQELTIAAWVRRNSQTGTQVVVNVGDVNTLNQDAFIYMTSTQLHFGVNAGSNNALNIVFPNGEWNHVAVTYYANQTSIIYVNGSFARMLVMVLTWILILLVVLLE